MHETWRVYEWFSWSHWGLFREPLFCAPDWFVAGISDLDDEDIEVVAYGETARKEK